jgi:hypothetical protein
MILLICFLFILWAIWSACSDADYEAERRDSEETAERRHRELIEAQKRRRRGSSRRTRTVARDEYGRVVAQEIVEEEDE